MRRQLHAHQQHALELLRASLGSGKRRPMLQAPTGFGKTLLAAAIVDGALRKNKAVIFVVPALSLVDQTVEAFRSEGIEAVGVMQGLHELTDATQPVQVASIQTLARRKLPAADVVIIDEAHRHFEFLDRWMGDPAWARIPFIGLSATPWTRGLGKRFDDLIIAATTQELIDRGFLAPFKVFAPSHPDLTGVRTVAGDFHESDLSEAMDKPKLVADIVETWLRRGENRPTLVFAVDRAHARSLERQFAEAGVATAYVDAYTPREDRREIGLQLAEGHIRVVVNVGCLTTGVDWDVRCIVLARPTKSEMLYVQIVGRGLRTAPGKADCLIFDHSDTTLRLGFVTQIRHATLDDGKPKKSAGGASKEKPEPLPKECPSCSFVKPANVHVCPACGFKPERQSTVQCDDGALVELDLHRPKERIRASTETKAFWFAMLSGYAQQRGFATGWVSHKFREKFGVWPDHYRGVPSCEPTAECLSWIKSRQIAFAKRRRAA